MVDQTQALHDVQDTRQTSLSHEAPLDQSDPHNPVCVLVSWQNPCPFIYARAAGAALDRSASAGPTTTFASKVEAFASELERLTHLQQGALVLQKLVLI